MPPRIRTRGAKALKENADVENKSKQPGKNVKTNRKVLGDKTNSLSDDNEDATEARKVPTKQSTAVENTVRPRRQRRLPTRFKENPVLSNLSTSLNKPTSQTSEIVPEVVKQVNTNENNFKSTENKKSESQQNQGRKILRRREKKGNNHIVKTVQSKEKDVSTVEENLSNQNDSQTPEKPPVSMKNVKTRATKSKMPKIDKRQIVTAKGITETPKKAPFLAQNGNVSISTEKIVDVSKHVDISKTFTPPSKRVPMVVLESIVKKRPTRIHRLPSRFDDHSVSPNKFIPLQPCHASTPLQRKNSPSKKRVHNESSIINIEKSKDESKSAKNNSSNKTSPDTNNNPKRVRSARLKVKAKKSPVKSPSKTIKTGKRLLEKSLSFKILDDNKKSNGDKLDVYEFTFDPAEEPPPQKKKKRRVVKKNPSKPKTVTFKTNYDKNISKALAALKSVVSKIQVPKVISNQKPQTEKEVDPKQTQIVSNVPTPEQKENRIEAINKEVQTKPGVQNVQPTPQAKPQNVNIATKQIPQVSTNLNTPANPNTQPNVNKSVIIDTGNKSTHENPPSIRVEDIEADFDISCHDDINYSPLNSPRPLTPNPMSVTQNYNDDRRETIERAINNKDPLNLQEDSFFDDQPVASSSMNVSIRHPLASPWRVEFGSLPIKWPANTYLKSNMTPAVESSFIASEDSNRKKHVYVNMIPETNDTLPQIVQNTPNLKQTSIISFIKEVAERNAKKKRGKPSPIKTTLFEDITNKTNVDVGQKSSKKVVNKPVSDKSNENNSNSSCNTSNEKENVRLTRKRKNENIITKLPAKSPRKEKDNNITFFGFDDSENQDQENAIPSKHADKNKVRSLRSRSKVLQEINGQTGPVRAALPLAAKTKIASSSEAVQRMYEELKSAEDAPQFLDKNTHQDPGTTNAESNQNVDNNNDEEESVHLFEDIDVVHHMKPTRKSYGKAKKVTFRHRSNSDSETQASDVRNDSLSSNEDDLADLTFTMPEINKKKTVTKKKSKKVMSKKEEKEADEWAAGFNSMCEDVEEFPLLVE